MQYAYRAADSQGRIIQGSEEADSREQLMAKLKSQGKYPLEIKVEAGIVGKIKLGGISLQERLHFTKQLAGLLAAGIPLERSLQIISRLKLEGNLGSLVAELQRMLQEGLSFTAALERFPRYFPSLYINMVRAGEAGGVLPQVLIRLGNYQEEEMSLRRFITSSLFYPVIVVTASIGALIFFLTVVIPQFEKIFNDLGRELPIITQIIIGIGSFLVNYWWLLLGGLSFGVVWLIKEKMTPNGRLRIDQFKLKIPLVGGLLQKSATARLVMALSLLHSSGVPLLSSLHIASGIVGNEVMQRALLKVEQEVQQGSTLVRSMSAYQVFPVLAVEMIGVGEESGSLGEMLEQVGKTYEADLRHSLGIFMSVFEPLLILVMVGLIALLAVGILLPIININTGLTTG